MWSTRDFPEKERVEIWRDAMVRSSFPIDVTPLSGRELEGRAALFTLGDIVICEGAASGASLQERERQPRHRFRSASSCMTAAGPPTI